MSLRPNAHDDLCPEELRLLRTRDGSREPSALRLSAIRDRAQAQWKAGRALEAQRRRAGAARWTLGLTVAMAAALFVVVTPGAGRAPVMMADGGYCPTELASYCDAPPENGADVFGLEAAPCLGFSPPGTSCFAR